MIPTPRRSGAQPPSSTDPLGEEPLGASPHRVSGRPSSGGHGWELVPHEDGVIALMERATVAEAHVWLLNGQSTIEFWVDGLDVPTGLATHLVGRAFAHPALGAGHAVLVCLPRANVVLLQQVLRHLDNARMRDAGLARLVEGTLREDTGSLAPAPSS